MLGSALGPCLSCWLSDACAVWLSPNARVPCVQAALGRQLQATLAPAWQHSQWVRAVWSACPAPGGGVMHGRAGLRTGCPPPACYLPTCPCWAFHGSPMCAAPLPCTRRHPRCCCPAGRHAAWRATSRRPCTAEAPALVRPLNRLTVACWWPLPCRGSPAGQQRCSWSMFNRCLLAALFNTRCLM